MTALAVAAAAAAILIAVSVMGGRSGSAGGAPATLSGVGETAALLGGIPQHGTTLGSPSAPVRLVEYADLQCVYCGAWARDVFPTLVRRYVRTGKVQLEFRGLAFVGSDSLVGLRTALAAAQQNRLWNLTDLLYRNQGAENSGWVSDSVVRGALAGIAAWTRPACSPRATAPRSAPRSSAPPPRPAPPASPPRRRSRSRAEGSRSIGSRSRPWTSPRSPRRSTPLLGK